MSAYIYRICHKDSGKTYIGKTTRPHKRKQEHFTQKSKSCRYLSAAIAKHGPDKFEWTLMHKCTIKDANALEKACILNARCRAPHGYNLSPGGEGGAHHADTIALMKQKAELRKETPRPGCWKVAQYSLSGALIKLHEGVTAAVRSVIGESMCFQKTRGAAHNIHTSISGVNMQVTAYGSRWQYVKGDNDAAATIEPLVKKLHPRCRAVQQFDTDGVLIQTFPSVSAAASAIGAKNQNINGVCHGIQKTCRGFEWRFTC